MIRVRESAGAAQGSSGEPFETLFQPVVEAIRGTTHPVGRGTRRLGRCEKGLRRRDIAARGGNYSVAMWRDISPLVKAKAVASALPPEPVLP